MDLLSMSRMPFTTDGGWEELARRPPRMAGLVAGLVLPLSLLAPAVVYIAGASGSLDGITGPKNWGAVAAGVLFAQLASVLVMGWLIRQLTATFLLALDYGGAYRLAAVAAVPLWVSSLGLALPRIGWSVAVALAGFALCCALLYHGLRAFRRDLDEIQALGILQIVVGMPLIGWGLLYVAAFVGT